MNKTNLSNLEGDVEIIVQDFEPDESGRIIGHCPEVEDAEQYHCWKLVNSDKNSRQDFFLLVSVIKIRKTSLLSVVVALEEGGLAHFAQYGDYLHYMEKTFIQTIKLRHGAVGPINIVDIDARTYYKELEKIFIGTLFRVGRYDADGNLLGPYKEVSSYEFPKLPIPKSPAFMLKLSSAALPAEKSIRLVAPADFDQGRTLYFPIFEEHGDDFDVDGGMEIDSEGNEVIDDELMTMTGPAKFVSIGAETQTGRAPGIHIEFTSHGGDPSHVATLFWYQPRKGDPKFLFGDYCTQVSFGRLTHHVFKKKRSSWFRKSTKITTIRKELFLDGVLCQPIP